MNGKSMHWVNRLAVLGLVVGLTAGFAVGGVAQSVGGQAYSTYVNTPVGYSGPSALAVLPAISGTDGAEADAQGSTQTIAGALSSDFLNSITSGEIGTGEAGAQSTASAASINILNGLVTAGAGVAQLISSGTPSGGPRKTHGPPFPQLLGACVAGASGAG